MLRAAASIALPAEFLAFKALKGLKKPMKPGVSHKPPQDRRHEDLLSATGKQDRAAFVELFRYYAPRVKSYLLKHGADDAAAEEIVQATFVTVWEKAKSFDPKKAAASTWIFTVARNKRIDMLRKQKYIEVNSDAPELQNAAATEATEYAGKDEVEKLHTAIGALPPEQAVLLRMAFFEDKSHQAISKETRLPLGTVKSRLRLAVEKLRHAMKGGGA
jgi:RNA polymerase sigma-70 factor (ECF subfamily)